MLERLYEDATSFGFPEERFERVYREVEATLYRDALAARVVAPLRGVAIEAERIELGDGLSLVRGETADAPAEAVWPENGDGEPAVLCVLERDVTADDGITATEAEERFTRLVSALRLWAPGRIGLGRARLAAHRRGALAAAAVRRRGGRARRATGSCRAARRPACASSSRRSSGPTRRSTWPGRGRASRWAASAARTPTRCPTTCSACGRCWTRPATPARPAWRCAWPRCAPRRAGAGWCSAASRRRSRWSAS